MTHVLYLIRLFVKEYGEWTSLKYVPSDWFKGFDSNIQQQYKAHCIE